MKTNIQLLTETQKMRALMNYMDTKNTIKEELNTTKWKGMVITKATTNNIKPTELVFSSEWDNEYKDDYTDDTIYIVIPLDLESAFFSDNRIVGGLTRYTGRVTQNIQEFIHNHDDRVWKLGR